MMRRYFILLVMVLSLLGLNAPAYAAVADDPDESAQLALAWLRTQQEQAGSFPGFGIGDRGFDPIFAFVAAGVDPRTVTADGGASLLAYAESQTATYVRSGAGAAGKALLAAHAADADPRAFGGVDLVASVTAAYSPTTGIYGNGGAFDHSLAVLALDAVGETVPTTATTALVDLQQPNGGWEYGPGFGTDTNATALAIQALVALGLPTTSDVFADARAFLRAAQNEDGGFPYNAGNPTDANSTGYVLQAIAALGESPAEDWARAGGDPVTALLALQNASGAFRSPFTGDADNILATLQAVPGLLARPLPMHLHRVYLPLMVNG